MRTTFPFRTGLVALALAAWSGAGLARAATGDAIPSLRAVAIAPVDSLLLGAPFDVRIRLIGPPLERVALTTSAASLRPFEVVAWNRELDRGDTTAVRLTLRVFRVGALTVPPLSIAAQAASGPLGATTDSLHVIVRSTVPEEATDPRDIKEAIPLRRGVPLWPFLVALAALALVALVVYLRRRSKPTLESLDAMRPAHEVALSSIERLAGSELARSGPWKEFYTELTATLRYYVARRFGINAPELTTSETLRALLPLSVPDEVQRMLREVLSAADGVKFAKEAPEASAVRRHLLDAEAFVRRTALVSAERTGAATPAGVS